MVVIRIKTLKMLFTMEKCRFVIDELGFDDCLMHKDPDFPKKLKESCPDKIDVYFENVGGRVFETAQGDHGCDANGRRWIRSIFS